MKRYAALFFIILTNAILFGHAVVPHHHHGMIIVWHLHETSENARHHETQSDHECPCQHQEENEEEETSCLLNQPIIIPTSHNVTISFPTFDIPNLYIADLQPIIEESQPLSRYNHIILKIPEQIREPMIKGWSSLAPPIC